MSTKERRKGACISKPLIVGTYSKETNNGSATPYEWHCLLRSGVDPNEDMSYFIEKVEFVLHDSFENSKQIVSKPPFEISEKGYGEFELVLKIYWKDKDEKPLTISHFVQLKPDGKNENSSMKGVKYGVLTIVFFFFCEFKN